MNFSSSQPPTAPTPNVKTIYALLRDGRPDWEAIDFDLLCSRCGYNLRMLPQPRCPECGLEFDWRDVLDASAWRSKFLFEHHWQTRPAQSWLRTTWAGLRPFRFWRSVSIHDRIHPGPLWFLLLTSIPWFLITMNLTAWLGWLAAEVASQAAANPGSVTPLWRSLDIARQTLWQMLFDFDDPTGPLWTLCFVLISLLAALALLCGLRQTLGRCRVRPVQILRVFAYASTPMSICLGTLFPVVVVLTDTAGRFTSSAVGICAGIGSLILLLACPTVFLVAGLKHYLQLPRATLLAATSVFVGALFTATTFLFIAAYIMS